MKRNITSLSFVEMLFRVIQKIPYTRSTSQNFVKSRLLKKDSRKKINDFYNKLNDYERAAFHTLFARIFRGYETTFDDGIWTINFMGRELRLPIKSKDAWLDWDLASSLTGHDVFVKQTYETLLKSAYRPRVFFDIGTNYGTHSLLLLSQNVQTVSFEPNPACITVFENLCLFNNLTANVKNVALADKEGEAEFWFPEKETWLGTMVSSSADTLKGEHNLNKISVKVLTLDKYVEQAGILPDLLKIDTEGNELNVLRGAENTIKNNKPFIIFECNLLTDTNEREKIFEFLEKLDYSIVTLPLLPAQPAKPLNLNQFQKSPEDNFLALSKTHSFINETV